MKNLSLISTQSFKRIFLLFSTISIVSTFLFDNAYGQTASMYSFASSSGTYTPITGGTVLSSGAVMDDNEISVTTPSFNYLGINYTQIWASENGYIQFGTTAPTAITGYFSSTAASSTLGIAGYCRDLRGRASSELRTQVVGSEIVFQWKDMTNFGSTAQNYNFQIRLNTSTGSITVVYGTFTSTASTTGQVGLRGSISDFNIRTTTSNWSSSAAGTVNTATMTMSTTVAPASGLNYVWNPPPPCIGKPVGGILASSVGSTVICPSAPYTLTVSGSTLATGIVYAWDSSHTSSSGPWTTIAGAILPSYIGSQEACKGVFYRRRIICVPSGQFDTSTSVRVNTSCALNPPYFENFETIPSNNSLPNCMTATNLGTMVLTYTAPVATWNRTNNTPGGSKFASFRWGANDYLFTPAINITAGKTYEFSYWYITDGLGGWDSLKVVMGSSPSAAAMTTTLGTPLSSVSNTVYKRYKVQFLATSSGVFYFALNCRATGVPWYLSIDDIALQEVPLCSGKPSPGTPEANPKRICGSGVTELDLPSLAPALGYTYRWQDSTSGSTWGDDPSRPTFGGSTIPFTTGFVNKTTYFRCIVKCSLTGDSSISSVLKVDAGPVEPPYFETFESITRDNQLPDCMSATNLGSLVLSYISSNTRNRINHTPGGSKFASFRWSCDDYIFTPQIKLIGGQKYVMSFWYITDGLAGWNTIGAKMGLDATAGGMTTSFKTISSPNNATYRQYLDTFVAPISGDFYFGIYCNASAAPWYLTIDDIGIQYKACDGTPTAAFIDGSVPSGTGVCPNTYIKLSGLGGAFIAIPGIKYQWQRHAIGSAPTAWHNVVGATDTVLAADTLGGYDYRLRILCSNTNDSVLSPIYSLPQLPVHPPITIAPSVTPIAFCSGDTVRLLATNHVGSVYDWTRDSVVVSGWKFSDFAATESGSYFVKVSSSAFPCPSYSNVIELSRNDPSYSVVLGAPTDSIFCEGKTMLITGAPSKPGLTYQWMKDNTNIPGATSNSLLVNTSGIYKLRAHDGLSACPALTRSVKMVVYPTPPAKLNITGNATACENEGVLLKANAGLFSYEWTKGGSTIFGWVDSTQLIKNSGTYRVKVRSSDGCVSTSLPVNINILPSPKPIVFLMSGFILNATGVYLNYWWIRNGTDTVSNTVPYTATKNGVYRLVVEDANGCIGESEPIVVNSDLLSINTVNRDEVILIYPNPSQGKFYVDGIDGIELEVKDLTGKVVITQRQSRMIDLSLYPNGLYLLTITKDNQILTQQKISKVN